MKVSKIAELTGHTAPLYQIRQGRDARHVFTAGGDRVLAEWNIDAIDAASFSIIADHPIYDFKPLTNHNLLVLGQSTGSFHVIDLATKSEIRHLAFHKHAIFTIEHDVKNDLLITGDENGILAVWSIPDFALQRVIELPKGKIRAVLVHEEFVFVGHQSGIIYQIELSSGIVVNQIAGHEKSVYSIAKHPNKPVLISGGNDGKLNVWKAYNLERVLAFEAHNTSIYDISFSPNGQLFATASRDKSIKLWNANDLEMRVKIERMGFLGHKNSVNAIHWVDDQTFASCSDDGVAMIWQIDDL